MKKILSILSIISIIILAVQCMAGTVIETDEFWYTNKLFYTKNATGGVEVVNFLKLSDYVGIVSQYLQNVENLTNVVTITNDPVAGYVLTVSIVGSDTNYYWALYLNEGATNITYFGDPAGDYNPTNKTLNVTNATANALVINGTNITFKVITNSPVDGSVLACQVVGPVTNFYWVNPVNDAWTTNLPVFGWSGVLNGTNGIYFRFPYGTNGWLLRP